MISYDDSLSSRLNRRAEIWKNGVSATKDALGQYPQEDQKVAAVWAGVTPQTGSMLSGRTAETQLTRTTHKVMDGSTITFTVALKSGEGGEVSVEL